MTLALAQIRRWRAAALTEAAVSVGNRRGVSEDSRRRLSVGMELLGDGWSGVAADAVRGAADLEWSHLTKLHDGLDDLADTLHRAEAALGPAVQAVRDRIAEAEASGLKVGDVSVRPAAGRDDVDQATVDGHAEAITDAAETVRSLDEHYGREIDRVAVLLHRAIPQEVDRSPIPGPDDSWPGRGVDAMTGAMFHGFPNLADDLDPETRGKHTRNPAPDDFGRKTSAGLRGLGRLAGPLGSALTVYDGVASYARGEKTAGEAGWETIGALGGGLGGGAGGGAAAGMAIGPVGAVIGAGIGAAVGSYLGQKTGGKVHEGIFGSGS